MTISKLTKLTGLLIFIAILLISGGCDNLGIFAVVAVTDKIEDGSLPEGISARPIVQVPNGPGGLMLPTTLDYAIFASGPGLWAKDLTNLDNIWLPKSLTDDNGQKWDGIQAMAASATDIYFALYRIASNETYIVSLYRLVGFDGTTLDLTALGTGTAGVSSWTSTASTYQTIRMFCPDPAGDVYINVMEHQGEYGTIDNDDAGFVSSELIMMDGDDVNLNYSLAGSAFNQQHLDGTLGKRYVTGVADNGIGDVRITATDNFFSSVPNASLNVDAGILFDETGFQVGLGSTVSTTGITFLPNVGLNGAFIASATAFDNSNFPMFASDDGDIWVEITNGTSTEFLTTNFIDVSATTAGLAQELVLAGTSSYIDGSTGRYARGYQEIDTTDADIANWSVNNSAASYDFARNNNYAASELSLSTITGMSMVNGILYASTRAVGIWSIDPSTDYPSWERE